MHSDISIGNKIQILTGIDLIEIERVKKIIERHGNSFLRKVFTEKEIEYCNAKKSSGVQSIAARFSAKEAVLKALGTGLTQGISLKDIEIINDFSGKPVVNLYGKAMEKYENLGGFCIEISLTHCKDYAAAQAAILVNNKGKI